jgi:multicomponent K+:H+ antiporter subunit E
MKLRALLPAPIISGVLFITWLMLNESASLGQMLLGAALALAIPWFTERVRADKPRPRAWATAARLAAVVLWDIIKSNIDVARRVLGPEANIQPRFFWLPLTIRDPHGIVLLAGIITTTPGTISADLSPDRTRLLVHALHCPDEAAAEAMVADIKARYEAPLMEIFE